MADEIDKANDLAEMERSQAVRDALKKRGPAYVGRCHNCDDPIDTGAFCSPECRGDYEKRERMKR